MRRFSDLGKDGAAGAKLFFPPPYSPELQSDRTGLLQAKDPPAQADSRTTAMPGQIGSLLDRLTAEECAS